MKDNINLWFVDGNKKKRIPQVFSKVLLNFMLGRYPTNVFEKFSKHRLEYILVELLTKITNKNFFSETKPIWWPDSIEFVPISVLREKIAKNTLTWILHLQELLLCAREFYAEQLYLSRTSRKRFNIIKVNALKSKPAQVNQSKSDVKTKLKKAKCFLKISPSIFKSIRNENSHSNILTSTLDQPVSHIQCFTDRELYIQCEDLLTKSSIDRQNGSNSIATSSVPTSFVDLENVLKKIPVYISDSASNSPFDGVHWKPFVYLNDILRKQPMNHSTDLHFYKSRNCKVKVFDILKPIIPTPIQKTCYMNKLELVPTSTSLCDKMENITRTVHYKKYSPSVPFSSIGGQLIIKSLKEHYHYNGNFGRNWGRGCSINDPLHQKVQDHTSNNRYNCFMRRNKIRSYHIYKFCRRRPFNSLMLPQKILSQYCQNITVNVKRLNIDILTFYMKDCQVILPRMKFPDAPYLQKCHTSV